AEAVSQLTDSVGERAQQLRPRRRAGARVESDLDEERRERRLRNAVELGDQDERLLPLLDPERALVLPDGADLLPADVALQLLELDPVVAQLEHDRAAADADRMAEERDRWHGGRRGRDLDGRLDRCGALRVGAGQFGI